MKRNQISTIIARKGSGKTALMQYLFFINPKSCIIFDPTGSIKPFKNRIFVDYESNNLKQVLNKIGTRIYKQKIDIVVNNCNDVDSVLSLIYNHLENICIVIDEIDLCYSAQINNDTYLYKICNFGRHKELDLIGVARRPANTPRALTSQSDYLYIGNSNKEPRDIQYLSGFVDRQTLDKYENLESYEFLQFDTIKNKSIKFKLPLKALEILNI